MSKIATFLSTRVAGGSSISAAPSCSSSRRAIGAERSLWEEHVRLDEAERHYVQLYRDPNIDVWLICWAGDRSTGYHDHDRSQGPSYVCDGALFEDFFHRDEDGWIRERTNRHTAGAQFDFDADLHPRCALRRRRAGGLRPRATRRRSGAWATTSPTRTASCGGSR